MLKYNRIVYLPPVKECPTGIPLNLPRENHSNEVQKSVEENEPKVNEDIKKLTKEIIALRKEISLKNDENIEIVTEKTKMNNILDSLNRKIHNLEKENMSLRTSQSFGK